MFITEKAPEAIGGGGLGHLAYYVAWEAIYRRLGGHAVLTPWVIAHWAFGPSPVLLQTTEEARKRCLSDMMAGRTSMCFGLSEPGAGSDASMITTRARRDGDGWRISGRKLWTTNAPTADWCIVFAVTDPAKAARKAGAGDRAPARAMMRRSRRVGVRLGLWCGRELRSAIPASPSSR